MAGVFEFLCLRRDLLHFCHTCGPIVERFPATILGMFQPVFHQLPWEHAAIKLFAATARKLGWVDITLIVLVTP